MIESIPRFFLLEAGFWDQERTPGMFHGYCFRDYLVNLRRWREGEMSEGVEKNGLTTWLNETRLTPRRLEIHNETVTLIYLLVHYVIYMYHV
jgi:hypothetical protein